MKNLIKLHTDSAITIDRMAQLLHENDIASMIKDNNAAGVIAGFGTIQNSVTLFVSESDRSKAEELIASFQ